MGSSWDVVDDLFTCPILEPSRWEVGFTEAQLDMGPDPIDDSEGHPRRTAAGLHVFLRLVL
jgi:hypothetical protein